MSVKPDEITPLYPIMETTYFKVCDNLPVTIVPVSSNTFLGLIIVKRVYLKM